MVPTTPGPVHLRRRRTGAGRGRWVVFAVGAVMVLAVLTGVTLQLVSNARLAARVSLLESLVAAQQRHLGAPETAPEPQRMAVAAASPAPTPTAAEESARRPAAAVSVAEKPVALPPMEASPGPSLSNAQRESLREKLLPVLSEQFGPLVAKLGLGVGEEIAFFDALVDLQLASRGGESARTEAEERLRAALGDAGFAAYLVHREGLGVRALVEALKKKLTDRGTPIEETQAKTLFEAINAERARHAALDAKDPEMPKTLEALRGQPPEVMEKFVASQMALVEAIEARAGEVLTPEQAAVLGELARAQVETLTQQLATGQ